MLGTAFGVISCGSSERVAALVGAPSLWKPVLTGLLLLLVLGAEALSGGCRSNGCVHQYSARHAGGAR